MQPSVIYHLSENAWKRTYIIDILLRELPKMALEAISGHKNFLGEHALRTPSLT